jgi:hypothetical protein
MSMSMHVSALPDALVDLVLDYAVTRGDAGDTESFSEVWECVCSCSLSSAECRRQTMSRFSQYVRPSSVVSWRRTYAYLLATFVYKRAVCSYEAESEAETYAWKREMCGVNEVVMSGESRLPFQANAAQYGLDRCPEYQPMYGDLVLVTRPSGNVECLVADRYYKPASADLRDRVCFFSPAYFDHVPEDWHRTQYSTSCESTEFGFKLSRDEIQWHGERPYTVFDVCSVRHAFILETQAAGNVVAVVDRFVAYFNEGYEEGVCRYVAEFTVTYGKQDDLREFIARQWHVAPRLVVHVDLDSIKSN